MELLVLALLTTLASSSLSAYVEPILSQSQAFGDQGQYEYSYKSGLESKNEFRAPDGSTQGSYSYLDSNGEVQHVKYTAGIDGFHAEGTNVPLSGASPASRRPALSPVYHQQSTGIAGETPEVTAARMQHAAAHAAALKVLPRLPQQPEPVRHISSHHHVPLHHHSHPEAIPVFNQEGLLEDTPEVEAARLQHAAAHAAALKVLPKLPPQPEPVYHQHHQHHHHVPVQTVQFDNQGALIETPEVTAARMQHAAAHAAALRVVPRVSQQPVAQTAFPSLHHVSHNQGIVKFAEEIPRNALGETPEVAEAREAHLAFYAKVRSELPEDQPNYGFRH